MEYYKQLYIYIYLKAAFNWALNVTGIKWFWNEKSHQMLKKWNAIDRILSIFFYHNGVKNCWTTLIFWTNRDWHSFTSRMVLCNFRSFKSNKHETPEMGFKWWKKKNLPLLTMEMENQKLYISEINIPFSINWHWTKMILKAKIFLKFWKTQRLSI